MIWATVSSRSCFYWLYRASLPLTAKNIISLIWVLTMYGQCLCINLFSWVVGKGCLLWPSCSLDKTLLAFTLLHFVLWGQTCLLFLVSLDLLLLLFNLLWLKGYLFWCFFLENIVGLHRTNQLPLLQHQWLGHRLGLLKYWMICLGNELRSFCNFWDCTQVLFFGLFIDYEGYSISSKGFLLPVVYTMVIWIKFIHSHPF